MSTIGIIAIIIGADLLIDLVLFAIIVAKLRKRVKYWRVPRVAPIEVRVYRNW